MSAKEAETQSYLVSRPLATPGVGKVASHNFVVTHARYPGDPAAKVHSFGHDGVGGQLDKVKLTTSGFSKDTHAMDVKAWKSMKDRPRPGDLSLIEAPCGTVESHANAIRNDKKYRAVPISGMSANSNTAAQAVADRSAQRRVSTPGAGRVSPGAMGKRQDDQRFRNEANLAKLRGSRPTPKPSREQQVERLRQRARRDLRSVQPSKKKGRS